MCETTAGELFLMGFLAQIYWRGFVTCQIWQGIQIGRKLQIILVRGHVPCVFIKVRAGEYRRLDTCIDTKEIGNGGNNRHLCPQVEEFLKEPDQKF